MSVSPATPGKSYDLYLRAGRPGERRMVWIHADHGVTLSDDAIAWVADGRQSQSPLRDIVGVHLQLSYVGDDAIGSCRLSFVDGSGLSIVSSNKRGFEDAVLDRLYVEFVHDLHMRLAAHRDARASFTAGFGEGRYLFGKVVIVIAGLFFIITPVVLLLITQEWKLALLTYSGAVLVWPVYKAMQANAPRSYDPRHVPPELMPVRLNLPPKIDPVLLDSD
jgi:hypothetical protein